MKSKKIISIIAIIMVALMLASLVFSVIPAAAFADGEGVTQSDINTLKKQQSSLAQQVEECRQRVETLKEQKANVLEQRAALQEQQRLAAEQIEIISQEIDHYSVLIAEKSMEVDEAKNRESNQLERYRVRVRAMEENGGYNILALIAQSVDFASLLTAIDDMAEVMQSDKVLQQQYLEARQETEEIKEKYESEKADYESTQNVLKSDKKALEDQIAESERNIESLEAEIAIAIQEYEAAEAEEASAAATISNMIASYNAQQAAQASQAQIEAAQQLQQMTAANEQAAANGEEQPYTQEQLQQAAEAAASTTATTVNESGGLTWPVPCSTRVTSRYGNRSDPFTGVTTYHAGIDIDGFGNDGAPIVAAASGTVITASYDGAYGNYVIIDHGSMKTVYAHCSGLAVSTGQTVSAGQTIGYLGATGRATGTHCHFEVYVGDGRTDPAAYFGGLTYYNC